MIKKILLGLCGLVFGILIGFYFEGNFRRLIRDIFVWATDGNISFRQKDFYIIHSLVYYFSFGLTFCVLMISFVKRDNTIRNIKAFIFFLVVLGISLLSISSIDAISKIATCTMCDDGTLVLYPSNVNYENITALSLGLAILPSLINIFKRKNKK